MKDPIQSLRTQLRWTQTLLGIACAACLCALNVPTRPVTVLSTTNQPTEPVSLAGPNWTGTLDAGRLPATVPLLADLGSGSPVDLNVNGALLQGGNVLAFEGGLCYADGSALTDSSSNLYYYYSGNYLADVNGNLYYGDTGLLAEPDGTLHANLVETNALNIGSDQIIDGNGRYYAYNTGAVVVDADGTFYYGNGGVTYPLADPNGGLYYSSGDYLADNGGNLYSSYGARIADSTGTIYYGSGEYLADVDGNLYYNSGGRLADYNGFLYYSNSNFLADGYGCLYYGNGNLLASNGCLYYNNGNQLTDVDSNLYLANVAQAGTITPDHTLTIYDVYGTAYLIPCAPQ